MSRHVTVGGRKVSSSHLACIWHNADNRCAVLFQVRKWSSNGQNHHPSSKSVASRLIGPVDLLWRGQSPSAVDRTNECRVWLRFHPAMFEEAWKALTDSLSWCAELDDGVECSTVRQNLGSTWRDQLLRDNGSQGGLGSSRDYLGVQVGEQVQAQGEQAFICHASASPRLMDQNRLVLERTRTPCSRPRTCKTI